MDSSVSVEGGVSMGVSTVRASGAEKVVYLWFLETRFLFRSRNVEECIRFGLGLVENVALNVLQLGV
jgi:hypothetical protein